MSALAWNWMERSGQGCSTLADAFFEVTKFNGQKIRIFYGKVVPLE